MRRSVYNLLREVQQKMSGFAVFMNYQFMHFGVKAEPAALLSVEVELGGESMNLEDVADDLFQGLAVFFIHRQHEERQHDEHHAHGRYAVASRPPEQKEKRHADERPAAEADKLPLG